MAKFIQKSFARGIRSPSLITRTNIQGYDESARELYNMQIGRAGEVFRRAGTAIVSALDTAPARVIPFKVEGGLYVLCFFSGAITDSDSDDGGHHQHQGI